MKKIRTYMGTPRDVWLIARMGTWGALLHILKYGVPLPVLVRLMRLSPGTHADPANADWDTEKIATLARWACRVTRWSRRGRCLEQGLVTYRYLSRLNVGPYLMVGLRSEDGTRGSRGHAWVEAGGHVVGEDAGSVAPFTCVLAFDPNGDLLRERPAMASSASALGKNAGEVDYVRLSEENSGERRNQPAYAVRGAPPVTALTR